MKYIISRRIFESNISSEDRYDLLKEFCDENLAYLKDSGFTYKIGDSVINLYNSNPEVCIKIIRKDIKPFTWEDIKYDLIPFVQLTRVKYSMKRKFRIFTDKDSTISAYRSSYKIELNERVIEKNITEIVNDTIPDNIEINSIHLYINNRVGDKNWNRDYNKKVLSRRSSR